MVNNVNYKLTELIGLLIKSYFFTQVWNWLKLFIAVKIRWWEQPNKNRLKRAKWQRFTNLNQQFINKPLHLIFKSIWNTQYLGSCREQAQRGRDTKYLPKNNKKWGRKEKQKKEMTREKRFEDVLNLLIYHATCFKYI